MSNKTKSNTVRIIGGRWRSRRLPVIDSVGLRPTTDRVRETLFNWLMHDIRNARCLDLFAGSGALGFECLSRGAGFVQFVENNSPIVSRLRENLIALEAVVLEPEAVANVMQVDALHFLVQQETNQFDIVFLDPPFKTNLLHQAISLLHDNRWLAPNALIYVEQPTHQVPVKVPVAWTLVKQARAGQSAYALYRCD